MEFVIGYGVAGATAEEWIDFQNMYNRTVRLMHHGNVTGFPGKIMSVMGKK